jgi:alpha-D-ribose 1-methylphosphonate 5-triphosphate synthase subunit PhnH
MASIALCLVDGEAAVWLDDALNVAPVAKFLQFHTGAELCADPAAAAFALIARPEAMPELEAFNSGSALCPEQSATLVIQTAALEGGSPVHLTGPGIERRKAIAPLGLPPWFWDGWVANTQRFPLGIDVLMTDTWHFMGLPRTARRVDP